MDRQSKSVVDGEFPRTAAEQAAPLLPAQASYAAVCMPENRNASWCNVQIVGRLRSRTPIDEVRKAVARIVARQAALSAYFPLEQGRLVQRFFDSAGLTETLPVIVHDVGALACDDAKAAMDRARCRLLETPISPHHFPLFRLLLIHLPGDRSQIVTVAHHLIMDGYSTLVFERELDAALGGVALPPLNVDYRARVFSPPRTGNDAERHRAYWRELLRGGKPFRLAPPSSRARSAHYATPLDEATVRALRVLRGKFKCSDFPIILTAFAKALSVQTGYQDLTVVVPTLGRSSVDELDVIGNFFHMLPLRITAGETERMLYSIRRQFDAGLDHLDLTFAEILKEGGFPIERYAHPVSTVLFNQDQRDGPTPPAPVHSDGGRDIRYEMQVFVCHYQDGVALEFSYRPSVFAREDVERLAQGITEGVRAISAEPGEDLALAETARH